MIRAYRRCFRLIRGLAVDAGVEFPCAWLSLVLLLNGFTVVMVIEVAFGVKVAALMAPYSVVAYLTVFLLHWLWLGRSEQLRRDHEQAIQGVKETNSAGCWIYAFGSPVLCFLALGLRITL